MPVVVVLVGAGWVFTVALLVGVGWVFTVVLVAVLVGVGWVLTVVVVVVLVGVGRWCPTVGVLVGTRAAAAVGVFVGVGTAAWTTGWGVTQCGLPVCKPLPQTGPVFPETGQPPPLGLLALHPVGVGALHCAPDFAPL